MTKKMREAQVIISAKELLEKKRTDLAQRGADCMIRFLKTQLSNDEFQKIIDGYNVVMTFKKKLPIPS